MSSEAVVVIVERRHAGSGDFDDVVLRRVSGYVPESAKTRLARDIGKADIRRRMGRWRGHLLRRRNHLARQRTEREQQREQAEGARSPGVPATAAPGCRRWRPRGSCRRSGGKLLGLLEGSGSVRLVAARLVRHSKCVVRLAHVWLESDRAAQLSYRITGSMQVGQGCAEPDPGYRSARIALDRPFEVGDSRSIVLADALAHAESIGAVECRPYRFGLLYNAIASSHARRIRLSFASPSSASSRSGRAASAASYSVSAACRRSCASSDSAMS